MKAGATVVWTNGDDIPHTVTSKTMAFRSKALDTDDKFLFTFATPGKYNYFCSLHPHMTGTIVVEGGVERYAFPAGGAAYAIMAGGVADASDGGWASVSSSSPFHISMWSTRSRAPTKWLNDDPFAAPHERAGAQWRRP